MPPEADESKILQALEWHRENPTKNSLQQASLRYGVPRTTLQYRAKGLRKSRNEAHIDNMLLLPAEEEELAQAVLAHADRGFPVRICELERWALQILQTRCPHIMSIGANWHLQFF